MGRFPRVTHPSAARQQEQAPLLPLDLHVLGLPPAFNLSHDQTLQFNTFWFRLLYGNQPALLLDLSLARHRCLARLKYYSLTRMSVAEQLCS